MIEREIKTELAQLLKEYPVVTILGPRQGGKTTLAKSLAEYSYCNLELPENRNYAEEDPKAFLKQFDSRVILDEIQRVPGLLSYIQAIVDDRNINGQFLLTGSHQLEFREAVSQSLAGRVGILNLLPLSISELASANIRFRNFEEYAIHGFLPGIYDQQQRPSQAYSNYYLTYVERDVRRLINLKDLTLFEKFMKLIAGRVGQIVDYTSLGSDVGVDGKTIRRWLSVLEASFLLFKLPPYFENFGKRIIKSPKYYFTDTGLLTFLLGIENEQQVTRDPLTGSIFENLVVIECLKARFNKGKMSNLYFFRDSNGREVDIIFQNGLNLTSIEIKAGSTWHSSQFKNIDYFSRLTGKVTSSFLVFNGENIKFSENREALRFDDVNTIFERGQVYV